MLLVGPSCDPKQLDWAVLGRGTARHHGNRNKGDLLVSQSCILDAINHKYDCTHFSVEKGLFLLRGVFMVAPELLVLVFRVGGFPVILALRGAAIQVLLINVCLLTPSLNSSLRARSILTKNHGIFFPQKR